MEKKLRILMLEDAPADSELIVHEVRKAGIPFISKRVETREDFLRELDEFAPDIILSDYRLPSFDGLSALYLKNEHAPTTPFIIVTGSINEEVAVECIKAGSDDYVLKENLIRLCPAVKKALDNKQNKEKKEQAEKALRESEERFREFFENAPLYCYMISTNGLILNANSSALEALGYMKDELIGKPLKTIYAPESLPKMKQLFSIWKKDGNLKGEEIVIITKKGERRAVLLSASTVKNKDEEIMHSITLQIDITERKRAEARMHILLAAIEQASEAVIMTAPDGTIQYVNTAFEKITGYPRQEAMGKNTNILKSGKQETEFYKNLWDTIKNEGVWKGRFVNKKKDGTLYEENATIFPVIDPDGKIVNFTKIGRDVTEEVKLEKQFLQSQKMEAIGRLAGGIAHDFNNLLTGITVSAEMAKAELRHGDPMLEYIKDISETSRRAADLVAQLLAFSRKQITSPVIIDLNEAIRSMDRVIRRVIGEGIEFTSILHPKVLPIKIDAGQLDQIIMNLVVNALDAMPRGGKLTIKAGIADMEGDIKRVYPLIEPGQCVILEFMDNGIGIDKETLSQIFEPFFSTKDTGKGTGLGLSTVYGIVKQACGHIVAQSEPGKGTTFKLYFPLSSGKPKSGQEESRQTSLVLGGDEPIIIVDDEKVIRKLLRKALTRAGYKVHCASNGEEAQILFKSLRERPTLLITDMVLPDMSGVELALNLQERTPDLRTVFISGYAKEAYDHYIQLDRHADFIAKPFNMSQILGKIREVLDR
ncbi:MAG: PAS domain S-box protein [Candidatus Eremiobacteraeota bacterium]|nr:PAS domain S-box protein [Candidatus Eremiobacteraeota bacterium]